MTSKNMIRMTQGPRERSRVDDVTSGHTGRISGAFAFPSYLSRQYCLFSSCVEFVFSFLMFHVMRLSPGHTCVKTVSEFRRQVKWILSLRFCTLLLKKNKYENLILITNTFPKNVFYFQNKHPLSKTKGHVFKVCTLGSE